MSDIRQRVLTALALERTPGFNYSGNYLGVRFIDLTPPRSTIEIDHGPHCEDENGEADIAAICLLADLAMGSVVRAQLSPSQRLATVSMSLQFTGAPRLGPFCGHGEFVQFVDGADSRQGLCRVSVTGAGQTLLFGTGAFMVMNPPPGRTMYPLVSAVHAGATPLAETTLEPAERELLERAEAAIARCGGGRGFLRHFWGFVPQASAEGARCTVSNGPHLGNRVGHLQGGLQLGMAMVTAEAALPVGWMAAGISACFVGPGTGTAVSAEARVEHQGRNTAVVRTRIAAADGRGILDAVTTHIRRR